MALAIYHEARGESRAGQIAVGYTVLNRASSLRFPSTVCGVVYQKVVVHDQAYCQFSWACHPEVTPQSSLFEHSRAIAREVLARRVPNPIGKAVYFQVATLHRPPTKRASYRMQLGHHAFYAYTPFVHHLPKKKTMSQHLVSRDFFMKDIMDLGYAAVKGLAPNYASTAMEIVRGYTVLDDAQHPNGKPMFDRYIWTALTQLQITAGDISASAAMVHVQSSEKYSDEFKEWSIEYGLGEVVRPFLTLTRVDTPLTEAAPHGFTTKAVGPIPQSSYIAKLGSYPMQVHPKLPHRSIAAASFMIIQGLTRAGLQVEEHWIPENTAENFARYRLSDGTTTYHLDFHAPKLVEALKIIDAFGGRREEDGALVDNPKVQQFAIIDNNDDLEADTDMADSNGLPT